MNTSNVPGVLVETERKLGYDSRLVTLFRDRRGYREDICLQLPFIEWPGTRWIKKWVSSPDKLRVDNRLRIPETIPIRWRPHTRMEEVLVSLRDRLWRPQIERAIREYRLRDYDVYQLDGGLGLYRNASFVLSLKQEGKKLLCCYTGSDLRTRGVIPAIDAVSDANVSVEFDHLYLHPRIHHVFFPFDASRFSMRSPSRSSRIRIGHAPTNRAAKGSDTIVAVLNELSKEYPVSIDLIQNVSHEEALARKNMCDIFIDQIGDLGYGINSLESLAMGIPTCSCLAPGFAEQVPDHPFIPIDKQNLKEQLIRLILDPDYRQHKGEQGFRWVRRMHRAERTVQSIHRIAGVD
jgi:hypothetical protein